MPSHHWKLAVCNCTGIGPHRHKFWSLLGENFVFPRYVSCAHSGDYPFSLSHSTNIKEHDSCVPHVFALYSDWTLWVNREKWLARRYLCLMGPPTRLGENLANTLKTRFCKVFAEPCWWTYLTKVAKSEPLLSVAPESPVTVQCENMRNAWIVLFNVGWTTSRKQTLATMGKRDIARKHKILTLRRP